MRSHDIMTFYNRHCRWHLLIYWVNVDFDSDMPYTTTPNNDCDGGCCLQYEVDRKRLIALSNMPTCTVLTPYASVSCSFAVSKYSSAPVIVPDNMRSLFILNHRFAMYVLDGRCKLYWQLMAYHRNGRNHGLPQGSLLNAITTIIVLLLYICVLGGKC